MFSLIKISMFVPFRRAFIPYAANQVSIL